MLVNILKILRDLTNSTGYYRPSVAFKFNILYISYTHVP
jgi:hypothetical protein